MQRKSILINSKQRALSPNRLECSVCKQRFWMTSKYLDHMSSHKHFLLSCNICNKGFYNQKHLDEHYLTHNEVINTYDCSECPRKFLQKHQLEQHVKFHLISVTNPPVEIKKKKVRFNNILQSKDISDDEFSNDDSYEENSKDNSKITTTRSGRVVKIKKVFENEEPEVKSKRRKKSEEICENTSVISDNNTLVTSENTSVVSESTSAISESNLPSEVHNIVSNNLLSECVSSKTLCVVAEKIPDDLIKKCSKKGNICISKKNSLEIKSVQYEANCSQKSVSKKDNMDHFKTMVSQNSESSINEIKLHEESNSITKAAINNLTKTPTSNFSEKDFSVKPVADKQFLNVSSEQNMEKIEKVIEDVKSTCAINVNEGSRKTLDLVVGESSVESDVCDTNPASSKVPNVTEAGVDNLTKAPTSKSSEKDFSAKPAADRQFLYVGSKQNMGEIGKVIEEVKSICAINVNEGSIKTLDLDVVESSVECDVYDTNPAFIKVTNVTEAGVDNLTEAPTSNSSEKDFSAKLAADKQLLYVDSKQNMGEIGKVIEEVKSICAINVNEGIRKTSDLDMSESSAESNVCETNPASSKVPIVTKAGVNNLTKAQTSNSYGKDFCTKPVADKQFLYVGSKQNMGKIKKVIDEVKSMCKMNINEGIRKASDLDIGENSVEPNVCETNLVSSTLPNVNLIESSVISSPKNYPPKSEKCANNGILDKRIVNDFLVVKVTPELMREMQKKKLLAQKCALEKAKDNINSLNISCAPSNISPELTISVKNQKKDEQKETVLLCNNTEITSKKSENLPVKTSETLNETDVILGSTDVTCIPSSISSDTLVPAMNQKKDEEAIKLNTDIEIASNQSEILPMKTSETLKITATSLVSANVTCVPSSVLSDISIPVLNKNKDGKEAVKLCNDTEIPPNLLIPVSDQRKDDGAVKLSKSAKIAFSQNESLPMKTTETLKDTAINLVSENVTCTPSSVSSVTSMSVMNQNKSEEEAIKLNKDTEIKSIQKKRLLLETNETLKETIINRGVTNVSCTPSNISSKISISDLNEKKVEKDADKLVKVSEIKSSQNEKLCLKASETLKDTAINNIGSKNISCTPLNILKIVVINQKKYEGKDTVTLQKGTEITSKQNKTSLETKIPMNINLRTQVSGNINSSNINISDTKTAYSDIVQVSAKDCVDQQNNTVTNGKLSVNSSNDNKIHNVHNSNILKTHLHANKSISVDSDKIEDSKLSDACNISIETNSKQMNKNSQSREKSNFSMPTAQPNDTNDPVIKMSNKILELYKAKLEEKERRKKEKYERKKRQRYREETLKKQTNHSVKLMQNSKKTKLDESNEICEKTSMKFSADDQIYHQSHEGQEAADKNFRKTNTSNKNLCDNDTFCASSIVIGETYTCKWPSGSNGSRVIHDSSLHAVTPDVQNSVNNADDDKDKDSNLQTVKFAENAKEKAVKEARGICKKFEKTLSTEEYLEYLDKLDNLIFSFNICNNCSFVYEILRFCRKHIENYDVKLRAIQLNHKMMKSLSTG